MENSDLQTIGRAFTVYVSFVTSLSAVKVHKHFMKPSGEEIDHWTDLIYELGAHTYHLFRAATDIIIHIVIFGLFFKMSWKIMSSIMSRSDKPS